MHMHTAVSISIDNSQVGIAGAVSGTIHRNMPLVVVLVAIALLIKVAVD